MDEIDYHCKEEISNNKTAAEFRMSYVFNVTDKLINGYKECVFPSFRVKVDRRNSCVLMTDGSHAVVCGFSMTGKTKHFYAKKLTKIQEVFTTPLNSSIIGSYVAKLESNVFVSNVKNIVGKGILFPLKNDYGVATILNTM